MYAITTECLALLKFPHLMLAQMSPVKISKVAFREKNMFRNVSLLHSQMRRQKETESRKDHIKELLALATEKKHRIQNVQFNPDLRSVVCHDQIMKDIAHFCTDPGSFITPLVIDKTFNVGDFFVTTSCYKHLKVVKKIDGKHPWVPGPVLFHTRQDESIYRGFAHLLIEKDSGFRNLLFVGNDREKAIQNGLTSELPYTTLIFCSKLVKDNIENKLTALAIQSCVKKMIIKLQWCRARDLLGSQIPVTTGGFELRISFIRNRYLTHITRMQEIRSSNPPVVTIICDPNKSPA